MSNVKNILESQSSSCPNYAVHIMLDTSWKNVSIIYSFPAIPKYILFLSRLIHNYVKVKQYLYIRMGQKKYVLWFLILALQTVHCQRQVYPKVIHLHHDFRVALHYHQHHHPPPQDQKKAAKESRKERRLRIPLTRNAWTPYMQWRYQCRKKFS